MNSKIEQELVEFKEEIEEKFWSSNINMSYVFKRNDRNNKDIAQVPNKLASIMKSSETLG